VTSELKSPAMGILYSSCSLRYESGLNCRVGHSRRLAVVGASQLMVNNLYFVLQTYVALGRLSSKQSLGQDVPTSSGESSGSSSA